MLFLRNKKNEKLFNRIWSVVGFIVIGSMLLLYLPAFM